MFLAFSSAPTPKGKTHVMKLQTIQLSILHKV